MLRYYVVQSNTWHIILLKRLFILTGFPRPLVNIAVHNFYGKISILKLENSFSSQVDIFEVS